MTSGKHTVTLAVLLVALAGLGLLLAIAPGYLTRQGFPLDDAWIHAVYGRSLARSGMLAYNPGVRATGSTSPLWAVLLAIPQLLAARVRTVVLLTKLLGFGLHIAAALILGSALAAGEVTSFEALAGAMLVAFHPDLISASVSGMEVPLATLAACALLYAACRWPAWAYAIVCALAPLARPELGLLCDSLPFLLYVGVDGRRWRTLTTAAILGTTLCFGGMALRNFAISGLPLPATFYAKVRTHGLSLLGSEVEGFSQLLGHIALADSLILLAAVAVVAVLLTLSRGPRSARPAAAALLSGLLFCGVSFFLVRTIDAAIFYSQRYVLPGVVLLVGALPLVASEGLRRILPPAALSAGRAALLVLFAASVLIEAPPRYRRLANDARNIDDVQVAIGKSLARAPASAVVWVTDAGAIRYFGNAFVVDLAGLNNAEMLDGHAQAFLDAHPPRYMEIVGGWAQLDAPSREFPARRFHPSTRYTVTSYAPMENQWLVRCPRGVGPASIRVMGRVFRFRCAP